MDQEIDRTAFETRRKGQRIFQRLIDLPRTAGISTVRRDKERKPSSVSSLRQREKSQRKEWPSFALSKASASFFRTPFTLNDESLSSHLPTAIMIGETRRRRATISDRLFKSSRERVFLPPYKFREKNYVL